jgi:hypothetical protein
MLLGEPLTTATPFAASHGKGEDYGCVVLVRSFRARLGGKESNQAALSAQFGPGNGDWWFTVPAETLSLQPGDFVEAEIMLMPHGEPTLPAFKPERERNERFGLVGPVLKDVAVGEKLADFPAQVRAADEVAQFTMTGGFDYMPVTVEGFRHWGVPLLWVSGVWQDQQAQGGDGYQVEPDGKGGYRFTFVYPIRKDQALPMLVTRAECSTGIASVRDRSGRPEIIAASEGEFRLKAPALFAPGENLLRAGAPVNEFTGRALSIRAVPIDVSLTGGTARVAINVAGDEVRTSGAALTLSFADLARGKTYVVTVDGEAREMDAGPDSRLGLSVAAGDHVVEVRQR